MFISCIKFFISVSKYNVILSVTVGWNHSSLLLCLTLADVRSAFMYFELKLIITSMHVFLYFRQYSNVFATPRSSVRFTWSWYCKHNKCMYIIKCLHCKKSKYVPFSAKLIHIHNRGWTCTVLKTLWLYLQINKVKSLLLSISHFHTFYCAHYCMCINIEYALYFISNCGCIQKTRVHFFTVNACFQCNVTRSVWLWFKRMNKNRWTFPRALFWMKESMKNINLTFRWLYWISDVKTGRVVTVVCCVGIQCLSYPWLDTLNAHSKQHNLLLSDDRLREILHEPYHTDRICARREDDKQTEDEPMTSRPQKSRVLKGSLFISISIEPICPCLARRQLCVCVL